MCRWMAYYGSPIWLEELLYRPKHSLIDQSQHARMGAETTNGDGFGIGWYNTDVANSEPALLRGIGPAWSDRNLRELANHVESGLFFTHIRASTGSAVQQTNCHPFRFGRWLWMHNGLIHDYSRLKRELTFAVAPELYPAMEGSTDSELMFYLALTFGLRDDPPAAVARMVGFVESVGRAHHVDNPVQMTIATSNGEQTWVFRYSTERRSRSLFYSDSARELRALHPDVALFRDASDEARVIVSEPLGDLPGVWHEVPESSYALIRQGADELSPFGPQPPPG